jgi:signal transduction histidine kinase
MSKLAAAFFGRGLLSQALAFLIVPLVVLLVAIPLGSLALHGQAMRELVGERDARAARSSASALGEQLARRARLVQALAAGVHTGDAPADVLARFAFLTDDFTDGVAFVTRDGVLLAGPAVFGAPEMLVRLQELAARAVSGPAFSPVFRDEQTGEFHMLVAAPAEGNVLAMGAFSPETLAQQTLAGAFVPGDQATAYIVDDQRQVLYHSGTLTLAAGIAEHPGIAEALAGQSGAIYLQAHEGEHVTAYSPVSPGGWALMVEERWEDVDNPLLRVTQAAPLVLVPPLLLALVALWLGARQIVRPLQTLERQAADLAWGRFTAIEQPVGGIAEIRSLQATLVHMARQLAAAQAGLRDYIGAITLGQEEERRRLARELHDDTLQSLIALGQRVQLATLKLEDHPARATLGEIQQLLDQAVANLRRLMRALRPIYLEDLGLTTALEMLARETQPGAALPVDVRVAGTPRRLPAHTEMALYRMAQEALSNVVRHAQATRATLELAFTPEAVSLSVTDDGQGFRAPDNPAEFAPGGHFGLLGLYERAQLIGGRLQITSAPGQGTRISVVVPTPETSHPY